MNTKVTGTIIDNIAFHKTFNEILPKNNDELETAIEGTFTWEIEDWFALSENKYSSPRVKIGDFEWDILLFPQGNHNKGLAVYVEPHPKQIQNEETGELENADADWYCCAQFAVVLSKPGEDTAINLVNRSHHRFNSVDTDWGFANLLDLNHLKYPSRNSKSGYLKDGKLHISAYVRILKDTTGVLWHNFMNYDSKKVTGYVGFRNQGATCYLNSLLQSYFFTKYFRKLVYKIPTESETPNSSVPLALQRAFYQLQVSQIPLDTLELTRSFGWDSAEAFTQHDVQELNRILMDRLENRMLGTPVEGKLSELFVGKMKSYIKCVNVEYESSRVEDFWDLQLNVKNLKCLKDSFENYIEIELMNGENQYAAQDFGLQDAEKGVIFESFPPILHLQLKRFEYDFNFDQLIKINDRYEFPESFDTSPYMEKKEDGSNNEPCIYNLHGVLVHTGDISTGHYYAMIKPDLEDQWYRFDDEKVWKVTKKQVFEENFGLDRRSEDDLKCMTREQYEDYLITRHTSAYMLVYIRKDKEEELLQPVTELDVPAHVVTRVKKDLQEKEAQEKEIREAHLFLKINIHSISSFISYEGFDMTSVNSITGPLNEDLNDGKEQPILLKITRKTTLADFFKKVKVALEIPLSREVRLWRLDYRRNSTLRVSDPIPTEAFDKPLDELLLVGDEAQQTPLNIFAEEPYLELHYLHSLQKQKLLPFQILNGELINFMRTQLETIVPTEQIPTPSKDKEDMDSHILLFIKKFDASTQRISGFGHCIINQIDYLSSLSQLLSDIFDVGSAIPLTEEIHPDSIDAVVLESKAYDCSLITGDILCFQLPGSKSPGIFPDYQTVQDFYGYLRHRIKLKFTKSLQKSEEYVIENSEEKSFEFWIDAYTPYDNLIKVISNYLEVDPEYLKIFVIYGNERYALKSKSSLNEYLTKDYNCKSIPPFEYEILSIPLKDLERLRPIKFYWLKNSYIHYQSFEFEVSNDLTIKKFLDKIQNKIGFTDQEKDNILIWTNSNFQFKTILTETQTFYEISRGSFLFGRVLPDEVKLFKELNSDVEMDSYEHPAERAFETRRFEIATNTDKSNPMGKIDGKLVVVTQYFKEIDNKHGISFIFNLIPAESFLKTRERLHIKFGLGQKEFSKIKLGISFTTANGTEFKSLEMFNDTDLEKLVLYNVMNNLDCIYLDHPDRLRSHNVYDRPMVIKN
ncbi:ubiquitin-specific protease UBP15 NDAI_0I02530 [Naumovozyma dairenensis CBS 421]|uniref:ubiquitinyl hydrolase 1 n=1 Tax=Naumovozyma dairenensis (strain ATCC 10597 / BCRC 20456 / CBS 421 / NBRC 0211 / NRRL Y-12639) TaxID=1071378 RepID=G0WGB0_NAUDC|nr:hypothetical protein NDAI_0I02530 [Naumovozyma dairenensis CBS 421]CCD26821.1 hypothetical protein NDAI_0I02530 [Naumovozyma dairenensis CBS 421]